MADKALGSILNDIGAGAVYEGAARSAGAAGGPLAAANAIRYVTNSLDPNPQIQDQQHASGMAWIPTQAAARLGQRRAVLSNVIGSQNKWKPLHTVSYT